MCVALSPRSKLKFKTSVWCFVRCNVITYFIIFVSNSYFQFTSQFRFYFFFFLARWPYFSSFHWYIETVTVKSKLPTRNRGLLVTPGVINSRHNVNINCHNFLVSNFKPCEPPRKQNRPQSGTCRQLDRVAFWHICFVLIQFPQVVLIGFQSE